jgi:Pvc16 N-terminal domain/Carboxypeptidase regulatory-like domain
MICQLDELFRYLFRAVVAEVTADEQVGFDPPDDDWRSKHVGSLGFRLGLNVYLVELRENRKLRSNARTRVYQNGWVAEVPAPARVDCHYLISAWSPATAGPQVEPTQDEHDLLYAVTVALMDASPLNPRRIYGTSAPSPAWPVEYEPYYGADLPTEVLPAEGFPKYAEFWGTMGQTRPWRPTVYVVVTVPVVSREPAVHGPPVTTLRTDTSRVGSAARADTLHIVGGAVRDATGAVVGRAWVALDSTADKRLQHVAADPEGRFRFSGLTPGRYRLRFAAPGHAPRSRDIDVPSPSGEYDLRFPL